MASVLDAKVQSYIALYSGIISTLSPSLTTLQLLKTFDRSISQRFRYQLLGERLR